MPQLKYKGIVMGLGGLGVPVRVFGPQERVRRVQELVPVATVRCERIKGCRSEVLAPLKPNRVAALVDAVTRFVREGTQVV